MGITEAYKISALIVCAMMVLLWFVSLKFRDVSLIDRFWGLGFVLVSWAIVLMSQHVSVAMLLLASMVTIWGLRLSLYLYFRNRNLGEDYRYAEMRRHHGRKFWWYSLFSIFLLQGSLMLIVAAPVIYFLSAEPGETLSPAAKLGMLIWFTGFVFEAGGDWQLSRFKSNPANKGKLLTSGLWAYTRHPNYFGDFLQWWGFGLFATTSGEVAGYLSLIGPLVMTILLIKVSGVALLEKSLVIQKPGFSDYMRRTPSFFPKWPFWLVLSLGGALIAFFG